jgi:hypothetical protein
MIGKIKEGVCRRCGGRIVLTKWGTWMHRPKTYQQRPIRGYGHKPIPRKVET